MICPECGLVVGDRTIDVGSEWRTFSNDKDSKVLLSPTFANRPGVRANVVDMQFKTLLV